MMLTLSAPGGYRLHGAVGPLSILFCQVDGLRDSPGAGTFTWRLH